MVASVKAYLHMQPLRIASCLMVADLQAMNAEADFKAGGPHKQCACRGIFKGGAPAMGRVMGRSVVSPKLN